MGRHHLRRRGPIYRARNAWLDHRARPKTIKAPKWSPGGRDGLVVGTAMAFTVSSIGLAAVLTPGGARLAPVLAEPAHAPTAPAPEPQATVFVPPAEYEFPVAADPAPIPRPSAPAVRWVVEQETIVTPTQEIERKPEPRGRHWEPKVDHSRDRDDDRGSSGGDSKRHKPDRRWEHGDRPSPWPRDRGERGDRGGHGERGERAERGDRGSRGNDGGSRGDHKGGRDGGSRGGDSKGGGGKGGKR